MKKVEVFFNTIDAVFIKIAQVLATLSVAAFTFITFFQVIGRNLFRIPMIWSMDVSTLCFTWCVFIGSTIAVYRRSHYSVSIFPPNWSKLDAFLDLFGDLVGTFLFTCLIYYGIKYTKMGLKRRSDSLEITMNYFYCVIPISSCFMLYFNLRIIIKDILRIIKIFCTSDKKTVSDK